MQSFFYELISYPDLSPGMKIIAEILSKIFLSAIVTVVGLATIKTSEWIIKGIFPLNPKHLSADKSEIKNKTENKSKTMRMVSISVIKYTVYFIVICQVLSIFGVKVESIIAVAGIGSVAIGLGAQSLIKDIIMGASILLEDQLSVGDLVTIGEYSGVVEALGMRTIRIRDFTGDVHIIPNSEIHIITNMSKAFNRAVVEVPVSYKHNVDQVLKIIADEMSLASSALKGVLESPKVLGVTALNEFFFNVRIVVDCRIGENWAVEREIRRLLLLRFEKEGIESNELFRWRHCVHEKAASLRQS